MTRKTGFFKILYMKFCANIPKSFRLEIISKTVGDMCVHYRVKPRIPGDLCRECGNSHSAKRRGLSQVQNRYPREKFRERYASTRPSL